MLLFMCITMQITLFQCIKLNSGPQMDFLESQNIFSVLKCLKCFLFRTRFVPGQLSLSSSKLYCNVEKLFKKCSIIFVSLLCFIRSITRYFLMWV